MSFTLGAILRQRKAVAGLIIVAAIWAIALLFSVGLIVSTVAFTSRRRASEAAHLRRQVTLLQVDRHDVVVRQRKIIQHRNQAALSQLGLDFPC